MIPSRRMSMNNYQDLTRTNNTLVFPFCHGCIRVMRENDIHTERDAIENMKKRNSKKERREKEGKRGRDRPIARLRDRWGGGGGA